MPSIKNLFGRTTLSSSQIENDSYINDHFDYHPTKVQVKWLQDTQNFYYKVALPGLTDNNINIKIDDSNGDPSQPLVIIRASIENNHNLHQTMPDNHHQTNYYNDNHYQRPYGYNSYTSYDSNTFETSFNIPVARVNVDKIVANMDNGVLTVKFPKANYQSQGGRDVQLKSRL